MYFQFLIEDESTKILIDHVMNKIREKYPDNIIAYDSKFFKGIGGLRKNGKALEQKTGKLLNDLPLYLRAFNHTLPYIKDAALFIVLDNDKREPKQFRLELENIAISNMILLDYVFCIAVKEMEAWLLGDVEAIKTAYPNTKISAWHGYEQDEICDTWEVLANAVYPGGLKKLKRLAGTGYHVIGKAKAEWADRIGGALNLEQNISPSFQKFISELRARIEAA